MSNLGTLTTRIIADTSGFNSAIQHVNRQLKVSQSEFKATSANVKTFGSSTDQLKVKAEHLNKQLSLQKEKLDLYKKSHQQAEVRVKQHAQKVEDLKNKLNAAKVAFQESTRVHGAHSAETKGLQNQVKNLEQEYTKSVQALNSSNRSLQNTEVQMNRTQTATNQLQGQLHQTNQQIETQQTGWYRAGQSLDNVSGKFNTVGSGATDAGIAVTTLFTAPIAAMGVGSIKAGMEFESSFAGVRKTVDATEEEFAKMKEQFRDMTKEIPATTTEINNVGEAAGQLGIKKENIVSFTRTMIDMGVATNMTSDQAATSMARLANIMGTPQTAFDRLGSTIVDLGNNLATTESEIMEMGLRLAGAGKQAGMTEAQVLSFAGSLSSVGINAEAGGSAFSRVWNNMNSAVKSGGEELESFSTVAGMTASEFKEAFEKDAAQATISFIKGLNRLSKSGEDLTPILKDLGLNEIIVKDALLRASSASDTFTESLEIGSKAWQENNALQNEAKERYKTTESQLTIFKNKITDVGITLSESLLPALNAGIDVAGPIISFLAKMAEGFTALPQPIQLVVVGFFGVIAVAGPLLMILGQVGFGVSGLMTAFRGLTAMKGVGGFFRGITTSAKQTNVALQNTKAGATVAKTNMTMVDGAVGGVNKTFSKSKGAVGLFKMAMMGLGGPVGIAIGALGLLLPFIIENWDGIWNKTKDIFGGIGKFLAEWGPKLLPAMIPGLGLIIKLFQTDWGKVREKTKEIFGKTGEFLKGWPSKSLTALSPGLSSVVKLFSTDWGKVNKKTKETFGETDKWLKKWGLDLKGVMSNPIGSFVTFIVGKWKGLGKNTESEFGKIGSKMVSPIRTAKTKITGIITDIKNAFKNMKITIPKPKIPHVDVTMKSKSIGGVDVPYPSFNVEWHKYGGFFDRPTLAGLGEAGKEAIVPLVGRQMDPFADAVANRLSEWFGPPQQHVADGGTTIVIKEMNVRDDNDIVRISRELDDISNRSRRFRGGR